MNKLALPTAVATVVLITLAIQDAEGKQPQADTRTCSFLPKDSPHESKPQSPEYRGGCLEPVTHVDLENGGRLPWSFFTGATGKGAAPSPLQVLGHHGDQKIRIDLQPVVVKGHPFGQVRFYKASIGAGEDLCKEETYDVTKEDGLSPTLIEQLRGTAVAVPGYWDDKGNWHAPALGTGGASRGSLSCMSGVMAKCLLWGFVPWKSVKGKSLEPLHRACVRGARAHYLGNQNTSYTCRKKIIGISDRLGIQKKGRKPLQFESLWSEDGLECLARPRYPACADELSKAGLQAKPQQCVDPSTSKGGWGKALIAISSSPDAEVSVCPSRKEAKCLP